MKTFKLIAFHLIKEDGDVVKIPLEDALIINQENEKNTWLIEIFVAKKYLVLFKDHQEDDDILVYVVITDKSNDPAPFIVNIISKKVIGERASILFEGRLRRQAGYAEMLLETLLDTGLDGQELLTTFQEKMRDKDKTAIIRQKHHI